MNIYNYGKKKKSTCEACLTAEGASFALLYKLEEVS